MEADAVAAIQGESERLGIAVKTGVEVKEISPANGKLRVAYLHDGAERTVDADRVVNGAGRIANVDTLDLEAGNVKHDRVAVAVDDYLRSTSNPSVWVCGDSLVTSAQLSPLATYEGRIVGRNIVHGPTVKPDYTVVPSCVYTVPALSTVGLTEGEAREQGLDVKVSMVGHQSEDVIHLFALAMRHGIAASSLKDDLFAFPTFSSDVKNLF
jgi:glutathione reductase (NADPH)